MSQKPFLILQTGTFNDGLDFIVERYGDMESFFMAAAELTPEETRIQRPYKGEELSQSPADFSGILITGSGAMVSSAAPWMQDAAAWLRAAVAARVPTLGVCFGHQLLAYALGGKVAPNPKGLEAGTVPISFSPACRDDPFFNVLPASAPFHVHHYESVVALPPGAEVFGWNDHEPYHAVRFAPAAWGIQFHPEISLTAMRDLISYEAESRGGAGFDYGAALQGVTDTPMGPVLLQHFKSLTRPS